MSPTPVRTPRTGRRKSRSLSRRRIINSEENTSDEDKENEDTSKVAEEKSLQQIVHDRSYSRYHLRSTTQSPKFIQKNNTMTFGSICRRSISTPRTTDEDRKSRLSIFKTPCIRSAITDYTALKKQKAQWKDDVNSLLNKTWKVCHLSTMTFFNYKMQNLRKQYESTLKMKILDHYPSFRLTVKLSVSSCLSQNSKVVDAITFTVTSYTPGENPGEEMLSVVYEAWLFRTDKIQSRALRNSEWFPLMLFSGIEIIHKVVIKWLQSSFGCYITPRGFPSNSLLWLAAAWSKEKCKAMDHGPDSDMTFHYRIYPSLAHVRFNPPNDKGQINFVVHCETSFIQEMWLKIANDEDVINEDHMQSLHVTFGHFIKTLSCIPTSQTSLFLIQTPCVMICRDGRIKLLCLRKFAGLLQSLLELFLDSCYTIHLKDLLNEEIDDREEDLC